MYRAAAMHRELYGRYVQDVTAAVGGHMNTNVPYPQQNPNYVQGPVGNMGLRFGSTGPSTGNMGYLTSSLERPTVNMGPYNGSMGPRMGSLALSTGYMGAPPTNMGLHASSMGPRASSMGPRMSSIGPLQPNTSLHTNTTHPSTINANPPMAPRPTLLPSLMHNPINQQYRMTPPPTQNYYATHPNFIAPSTRNANHARIRNLTAHMLTNDNMSELAVINHYNHEIEYLRELRVNRLITASQTQQRGFVVGGMGGGGQGFASQQWGGVQGGMQQGVMQQGGVQGPGQRAFSGPRQSGERSFSGGQQGGLQNPAVQQPASAPGPQNPLPSQMPR